MNFQEFVSELGLCVHVPEAMKQRAIALWDNIGTDERNDLLSSLRTTEEQLARNQEEAAKIAVGTDSYVARIEGKFRAIDRNNEEKQEKQNDAMDADAILSDA